MLQYDIIHTAEFLYHYRSGQYIGLPQLTV